MRKKLLKDPRMQAPWERNSCDWKETRGIHRTDTTSLLAHGITERPSQETLEISWDTSPWLNENTNWSFVSGIEYRNSASPMQTSSTPDNFLVDYETINVNDFENMPDFNYSPFRLNKTMGIMTTNETVRLFLRTSSFLAA